MDFICVSKLKCRRGCPMQSELPLLTKSVRRHHHPPSRAQAVLVRLDLYRLLTGSSSRFTIVSQTATLLHAKNSRNQISHFKIKTKSFPSTFTDSRRKKKLFARSTELIVLTQFQIDTFFMIINLNNKQQRWFTFALQMGSESDLAPLLVTPPPAYESVDQSFEITFPNVIPRRIPVIECKVCHASIDCTGKLHQHVMRCNTCNEATPLKQAPPGKKASFQFMSYYKLVISISDVTATASSCVQKALRKLSVPDAEGIFRFSAEQSCQRRHDLLW